MFNILGSLVNTQPNLFITATSGTGESSRCRESALIGRLGWNIIVKKSKSMDCPSESKTLTLQRGGGGGTSIWKQLFQFSCESQPRAIPIGWDFPPYPLGSGVANNSEVFFSREANSKLYIFNLAVDLRRYHFLRPYEPFLEWWANCPGTTWEVSAVGRSLQTRFGGPRNQGLGRETPENWSLNVTWSLDLTLVGESYNKITQFCFRYLKCV